MGNWEYKGIYKNHDLDGEISLPNDSKLQVCDLIEYMPEFMKEADTLFIDPPCSQGNLTSFYTKNDSNKTKHFVLFYYHLFERIKEINPKHLYLELFLSNKDLFIDNANMIYKNHIIYDSFYYNKKSNKCWIVHFSNEEIQRDDTLDNIDEEKVIKHICENKKYNCIGDLCMGTGLVGRYAFLSGKKFVGIELNKKRLAILVDFIKKTHS